MSEGRPDDQLPGDQVDHTQELADVAVDAWQMLTALLLSAPPLDLARRLLADLPAQVPDPVHSWWLTGVRLAVDAGVIPLPPTAADAAFRANLEPPPALRRHVASAGWLLVSEVAGVPLAVAGHLVQLVRDAHVRRASEMANERIAASNWRGEVSELAELWQREAGAVLALLAAEVAS
jgi:hypothetical protein